MNTIRSRAVLRLPARLAAFAAIAGILVLSIATYGIANAADTAPVYVKTLATLEDAAGGQALARLMPATPLIVRSEKDGYLEVDVKGWSPVGGDKYLFKEVGIRINLAVLSGEGVKLRTVGDTKEDDWGGEWQDATITGWIPEKDVASDLDGIWKDAATIYFSRCTRCHSLRRPGEFTANQWPQALRVMTVRAGLTKDQAALVTMLLQYHGRDQNLSDSFTQEAVTQNTTAPAPATKIEGTPEMAAKGGELFKSANCFACHGEDAKTPVLPEYPKLAGQNAEYLFKQILDFKGGARTNDANSAMKDNVTPLSDDDARAIAYWLSAR